MYDSLGMVKFNERILNDRLQRFVDEHMRQWLRDQGIEIESEPANYEVSFFNEDVLDEVSCLITAQSGSRSWRSWETAPNARLAFGLSLERLHLDTQLGIEREENVNGQRGSPSQQSTSAEQTRPLH